MWIYFYNKKKEGINFSLSMHKASPFSHMYQCTNFLMKQGHLLLEIVPNCTNLSIFYKVL